MKSVSWNEEMKALVETAKTDEDFEIGRDIRPMGWSGLSARFANPVGSG